MEDEADSRYRALLDALPVWAFVVDDAVRVLDLNAAAAQVFTPEGTSVLSRRGGEVLHCLHALDSPAGCGSGPFCPDCAIRNSVAECLRGARISRRRTRVTLVSAGLKRDYELLVSASPMPARGAPRALLILEDMSELSALQDIVPICAGCKRVRDDQEYWRSVERYLRDRLGVDFTHGVCPSCQRKVYAEATDD